MIVRGRMESEGAASSSAGRDHDGFSDLLQGLRAGGLLTAIGLDVAVLRLPANAPRLLRLDLAGAVGSAAAIARILDDLAALALAAWPAWPPPAVPSWRRAADRLAAAGRAPRFRSAPNETQFSELHAAAGHPVLLFTLDAARPERAAPLIATLEWCRRRGAGTVAAFAERPGDGPPWDRVLHGALTLATAPEPPAARLVPVEPKAPSSPAAPGGSATERRMRARLAATPDLAGLFDNEVTLSLGPLGPTPRVDLLWREGRVVVEIDGAEHERDPIYAADRHRDYELLVAGYLVLRITNAEVELDLDRAVDKVRRVVALRRPPP